MRRALVVTIVCLVAVAGCLGDGSEPAVRDRRGPTATVTVRSAITGTVRWTARVPGRCGSVRAAGDGYLIVNRQVLDRPSGARLWRLRGFTGWGQFTGRSGDGPVAAGPTVVDVQKGKLQGRDPRTGSVRWTRRVGWIRDSSALVGPTTIVAAQPPAQFGADVEATAWDRRTGAKQWTATIPNLGWSSTVTSRAVVAVDGELIQGLDLGTGKPRWVAWLAPGGRGLMGAGAGLVVLRSADAVEARDEATGEIQWSLPGPRDFLIQPEAGVLVVFAADESTVQLVDLRSGDVLGEVSGNESNVLAVSKTRVIRARPDGYEGVTATGRTVWTARMPPMLEDTYVVGKDFITITDRCDQG